MSIKYNTINETHNIDKLMMCLLVLNEHMSKGYIATLFRFLE